MLTEVAITSDRGELLFLSLTESPEGYVVQEIEGLDPVKATIVSSSFANMDGEQYQASRREARNIVFRLGLVPDYAVGSVRDLRARLYKFFMPKSEVLMQFITDEMGVVEIRGRVETFNAPLFSANPIATISLMCFDPDFLAQTNKTVEMLTASAGGASPYEIDYLGSVDTGVNIEFDVGGPLSNFKLLHNTPSGVLRTMDFSASMINGDKVYIDTVRGKKAATLISGGVGTPMLYGVSAYSDWIRLEPGLNNFQIYIPGKTYPYRINYVERFGGL